MLGYICIYKYIYAYNNNKWKEALKNKERLEGAFEGRKETGETLLLNYNLKNKQQTHQALWGVKKGGKPINLWRTGNKSPLVTWRGNAYTKKGFPPNWQWFIVP